MISLCKLTLHFCIFDELLIFGDQITNDHQTEVNSMWRFCIDVFYQSNCQMLLSYKGTSAMFITIEHNVVELLVGRRTCDLQLAGSSPGWAPLRSGLGQSTYTCVPLSPCSIIWYRPRGVISLAGKVTAGLVESNGSLPPSLWLMSPAGWLPRNRDHIRAQRS